MVSDMMTAEQLKGSILQLAMQGKLVEQRPEEGTGDELYKEIQAEKKRLIKEGKIKKGKLLQPVSEESMPFDIPMTWKWVHLESVISLLSGADLSPDKYNSLGNGTVYITGASNIEKGTININRWTEYPKNIAHRGDLLLTCKGTVGKTAILDLEEAHIARQIMAVTPILCNVEFVDFFIQFIVTDLQKKAKSMIPGIERASVLSALLPLPPIEEQKRIVAKIEELMPFVEQYAAASTKLNTLNTTFPDQMKKSILQEAVQGKLVPQDPNDEPASVLLKKIAEEKKRLIKEGKIKKQKALPEITEDEIPFDVPESWEWARLGSLILEAKDGPHFSPKYLEKGVPFISTRNISSGKLDFSGAKYISEKDHEEFSKRVSPKKGDILYSKGGTTGIAAVNDTNEIFDVWVHVAVLSLGEIINPYYLAMALNSPHCYKLSQKYTHGTSNHDLGLTRMVKITVPVPPVKEQQRIIDRLNEILPIVELFMEGKRDSFYV